jgi:2-dehydropantoate 2-reductase
VRIAVVGPGAVGCFFAAHLAAAGHHVTACGRHPFERYVIESPSLPAEGPADVVTDPSEVERVDIVFVTVKVTQNASIGGWLNSLCGPQTVTVSAQNGIENEHILRPLVSAGALLPSVVYCGVQLLAPGHVRHTRDARLIMPRRAGAAVVAAACAGSAIRATLTDDFVTEAWRKLGVNAAVNGITALTRRRTDVFQHPGAGRLAGDLLRECWAVGRLFGADLDDDAATRMAGELIARPIGAGTSMLYDRLKGLPTEHEAIYGAIVRAAETHGVDAPLARALGALLAAGDP